MKPINVGIIGTGWTGGIRANACSKTPLINELHIAETNPERLKEIKEQTNPTFATNDWEKLIQQKGLDAIIVSATPESTHYPMIKAALEAGKHVFVEKPLAMNVEEGKELLRLSQEWWSPHSSASRDTFHS